MTTDIEKIEHIKALNRERQKRFYEKNKERINAKHKKNRYDLKMCKLNEEKEQTENVVEKENNNTLTAYANPNKEQLIQKINAIEGSKYTIKTYINSLNRLSNLLNTDKDYKKILNNSKKVIELINESKFKENTIKALYQFILVLRDKFKLILNKKSSKAYDDEFSKYKIISNDNTTKNINEKETISMDNYLKLVKDKYKQGDKFYTLIMLYDELTIRDNYGDLYLVGNKQDITDDKDKNFIYIPKNKASKGYIQINSYKTEKLYGIIKHNLSLDITRVIRDYIYVNEIKVGDTLFGKGKLSAYITKQNKTIQPNLGSINEIRHRKVSQLLNNMENLTPEDRLELAEKMRHSPATQLQYLRLKTK